MLNDPLRRSGLLAIVFTTIYLGWLFIVVNGVIGWIFFWLEIGMSVLVYLFLFNHWSREYKLIGGSYSLRNIVDVFITTRNEPLEILEQTIEAAVNINYPNKQILLLDDGDREDVKKMAMRYGCRYLVRSNLDLKKTKAANLNFGLKNSFGNFVLVLDADDIVHPTIIDDMLGHFKNKEVGMVVARKRFKVDKSDFNNDNLFYEYMQTGKNTDGASISCGSGVIYRCDALDKIGGFQEWNIVEDLYTSYVLNSFGYKNVYLSQDYTTGIAPKDLEIIYKQRGLWSHDTLRLFFWKNPLFNRKLNYRQRLHYFEIGYIYLASAIFIPGVYFLNFYSILFNDPILHVGYWYLLFKLPSFVLVLFMYNRLGQGDASSRMWAALYPVFLKSTFLALLYKKPAYSVTSKEDGQKNRLFLTLPQLLTILTGVIVIIIHLYKWGISSLLVINFFWFLIMVYWLWPVFPMAFNWKYSVQYKLPWIKKFLLLKTKLKWHKPLPIELPV